MKSPVTGKEMQLCSEDRKMSFRKENFTVRHHYYLCDDTGEQFTTTELDELNINQLCNQYRQKYNLPFPDEIKAIREKYELSAAKMSEALGFGVNVFRNYESGEVPNESNGKLIRVASDPGRFRTLVELSTTLPLKLKSRLLKRIDDLMAGERDDRDALSFERYLLGSPLPDEYSGYRRPNMARFVEMVVFFAERLKPWKTKLNKLLFYADFVHFRETGFSISGVRYCAIDMGPVPNNFNALFNHLTNSQVVGVAAKEFESGAVGEQFMPVHGRAFDRGLFTESELATLNKVASTFEQFTAKEVVNLSHEERAWKEPFDAGKQLISYNYGFELKVM